MTVQPAIRRIATVAAAAACAITATTGLTATAAPVTRAPVSRAPAVVHDTATTTPQPVYKGRVIARTGLLVRNAPSTSARVVGSLRYHQVVDISCKVTGQWVNGNHIWYRLPSGHWAYASARYIANIGPAPMWCHR